MARILPSGAAFGRRIPTPGPGPVAPVTKVGPKEMLEGLQLVEAVAGSQAVGAILKGLGWVGEQAYDAVGNLLAPDLSEAAAALSAKGVSLEDLQASIPQDMTPADQTFAEQPFVDEARAMLRAGMSAEDVAKDLRYRGALDSDLVGDIMAKAQPEPTERDSRRLQVEARVAQFLQGGGRQADAIATMVDRGATPDEARQIVQSAMAQIAETPEPVRPPHQAEVMAALQQGVDPAEILDALVKRDLGDKPADVLTMAARREEAQAVIDEARGALGPAASAKLMAREEEVAAAAVGGFEEALALAGSARTPDERGEALRMAVRHAPKRSLLDMIFPEASQIAAAKSAEALMPREFRPEQEMTELERQDIASKIARRAAITEENKAKIAKQKAETDEIVRKAERDKSEQKMRTDRYLAETKKVKAETKKLLVDARKEDVDALTIKDRLASPIRSLEARIKSVDSDIKKNESALIKAKSIAAQIQPEFSVEVQGADRRSVMAIEAVERARAEQALKGYQDRIDALVTLRTELDTELKRLQGITSHAGIDAYLGTSPAAEGGAGEGEDAGEDIGAAADEAGLD